MKSKRVVDLRVYTMRQGGVSEFLRFAREVVIPVQLRHIGPPIAYYVTDIGPQQEVMHLWGYESMADMEVRRQARNLDAEWPRYLEESDGLILKQETTILRRIDLSLPEELVDVSATKSLVEFRVTTIHRGRMPEYLKLFQRHALEVQLRHVGAPVALYVSEVGHINQLIQIWGFDNYADMERRREARDREAEWTEFQDSTMCLVVDESVRISKRVAGLFGE